MRDWVILDSGKIIGTEKNSGILFINLLYEIIKPA